MTSHCTSAPSISASCSASLVRGLRSPLDDASLTFAAGCDLYARYRGLLEYYRAHGFNEDAKWVEGVLAAIDDRRPTNPGNPSLANAPLVVAKVTGRKRKDADDDSE